MIDWPCRIYKACIFRDRTGVNKLPQYFKAKAAEIYSGVAYSATAGVLEGIIRRWLITHDGRLRTTKYLPWYLRRSIGNHFAYREWAEIARGGGADQYERKSDHRAYRVVIAGPFMLCAPARVLPYRDHRVPDPQPRSH